MSDWLELELAHRLPPAEAPEELWQRVAQASACRVETRLHRGSRVLNGTRRAWPIAVMALLTLTCAAFWLANVREAAATRIASHDPRAIRLWLRQHSGLDVPLPDNTTVRLTGARVLRRGGERIAAVEYRAGRDRVTLLVARADPRYPLPPHGTRVSAWQARDQVYTLAGSGPDRMEAACQLCHANL